MNKLYISPAAESDLEEIKTYITNELENHVAALSTVSQITKSIRILQTHAFAGAPLSSIIDIESDYRFLVSKNYLIFCRAYENTVYIDRILYRKRDYLRILFEDNKATE
ncbi:MAG: type II toxin-antitoxin system RelE/ParE family toxin [Erysipelotrichaceae bacterium]|nr:type II toxin-antitoxin system RelE/ParE family toxin [Erysipelotrichaceae bacterium]MDY5251182.1 type II toxin-antitoxin system RelE/ParE family toxin [Erysipelotrichaceae bacterium]